MNHLMGVQMNPVSNSRHPFIYLKDVSLMEVCSLDNILFLIGR